MSTSESLDSRHSFWRTESRSAKIHTTVAEPDRFNFLAFLATAQALQIEFLPLAWDASGFISSGATARIHQAIVNMETTFAFKTCRQTYTNRKKDDAEIFRTLINEITVMSQAFVRNHTNIAHLQGICWDISPDDKPWPVLVLEKSHLGDLSQFVAAGGKDMDMDQRLRLCLDIGTAIMDMHSNRE